MPLGELDRDHSAELAVPVQRNCDRAPGADRLAAFGRRGDWPIALFRAAPDRLARPAIGRLEAKLAGRRAQIDVRALRGGHPPGLLANAHEQPAGVERLA